MRAIRTGANGRAVLSLGLAIAFAGIVLAQTTADAEAVPTGDAARGHEFAKSYCSPCHAVEAHELTSRVPEAPAFATFSRYWPLDKLRKSLSAGIMVGHDKYPMPVFQLGPQEIADLIAYLRTIQEAPPEKPAKPRN